MAEQSKKVLITGGAGYLGSVLTERLMSRGHQICVLDSQMYGPNSLYRILNKQNTFERTIVQIAPTGYVPDLHFVKADIRDTEAVRALLQQENFDAIVHLAAIVGVASCEADVEATREINVDASLSLIDMARELQVGHFLFASTYSVYGNQGGAIVDETAGFNPTSAYEKSKIEVEEYLAPITDLSWTVFRFATACGLSFRTRFDLLSNQLTVDALAKGKIEIFQGADMRSFVHVRDIARAITVVLESENEALAGEVFNVGEAYRPSESEYGRLTCSKEELAFMIQASFNEIGRSIAVGKQNYAEDARNAILTADKLRTKLGFVPERSLKDAISEIASFLIKAPDFDPHDVEYYEQPGVLFGTES